MPPGKIVSWKKILIERMPTPLFFFIPEIPLIKINSQHLEQNLFQPQTVYHVRSV